MDFFVFKILLLCFSWFMVGAIMAGIICWLIFTRMEIKEEDELFYSAREEGIDNGEHIS